MSQVNTLKIGEILVREGYLTMDACQKVLKQQKELGYISKSRRAYKPFGQLCVELKLISPDELKRVLHKHNKRIRLGELLLNQGLIKPRQLEQALERQQQVSQKIGQLLLQAQAININQLLDALSLQLDLPRMTPALEFIDPQLLQVFPLSDYQQHGYLPLYQHDHELTVVMADPLDEALLARLKKHYRCKILPALADPEAIAKTLAAYAQQTPVGVSEPVSPATAGPTAIPVLARPAVPASAQPSQAAEVPPSPVQQVTAQQQQAEQVLHFLFKNALQDRATAIHLEPQQKYLRIRYRIDGVLHHKTDLPTHLGPLLMQQLKKSFGLSPEPALRQQRGRIRKNFEAQELMLQLATYPSVWGENLVLGVQTTQSKAQERLLNLDRLGFSPLNLMRYQQLLHQPGGLVILTGPARTGKSTTLYASIYDLNQQNRSIITAENPIEMPVPGTIQGQFKPERDASFAELVRSMSYLDPDILMVSNLDSPATLEAVVEIASSGAKVLTAYGAFDATGALLRLNRMGLEQYLIAATQLTVLSQRLVRQLCTHCRQPEVPDKNQLQLLGLVDVEPEAHVYYHPVGCELCQMHGFVGQTAIHELLCINEAIREAILEHKPAATIRGIARTEAKLVSMAEDGLYKAMMGVTSLGEVQRVAFVNEYDAQTPWEAEEIYRICHGLEAEFI